MQGFALRADFYFLDCHDSANAKSCNDNKYRFVIDCNANRNRSNGGVAFVFVRIFGIETRLMVCEIPKNPTSEKLHTPEQIEKNAMNKLHANMLHKLRPTSCISLKCPAQ